MIRLYSLSKSSVTALYKKNHLTEIQIDHLNFYIQRQLALKITTLYRFQKSIS